MNTKVIVIVVLVVAGAILLTRQRSKTDVTTDQRSQPPNRFGSRDEVSLTANVIIGELEAEAAEALPPDLRPNMNALSLSEEEENELFAILNSVTDHGVVGIARPLGAPIVPSIIASMQLQTVERKMRAQLKEQWALQSSINDLKKKIAKANNSLQKTVLKGQLKKVSNDLVRAKAERTAKAKERNALHAKVEAEKKAAAKKKADAEARARAEAAAAAAAAAAARIKAEAEEAKAKATASAKTLVSKVKSIAPIRAAPVPISLNALKKQHRKMVADYKSLDAHVKHQQTFLKKRLTIAQKIKVNIKISNAKKRMANLKSSAAKVNNKIIAEAKRLSFAKKDLEAKELAAKVAREKEAEALRVLKESEAKALLEKARLEKEADERGAKKSAIKRAADVARMAALADKARVEKADAAAKARLQADKLAAKKLADALAAEAAALERKKMMLEEEENRKKMVLEEERKRESARLAAEDARRKIAGEKKRAAAQLAENRANEIQDLKMREAVQQRLQAEALDLKRKKEIADKKLAQLAMEEEKRTRETERRLDAEMERRKEALRREEEEVARRERQVKAAAKDLEAKASAMAAKQKQLEQKQKQQEQQALVLEKEVIVLQKTDVVESAKAVAAIKKIQKDVTSKQVFAKKAISATTKAITDKRLHEAEAAVEAAKAAAFNNPWIEIERITGLGHTEMMSSPEALQNLRLEVVEELAAYLGTLSDDFFTRWASELGDLVFSKKLTIVGNEIGIDFTKHKRFDSVDFESVNVAGLEKMIVFLDSEPMVGEHPAMSQISPKLQAIVDRKTATTEKPPMLTDVPETESDVKDDDMLDNPWIEIERIVGLSQAEFMGMEGRGARQNWKIEVVEELAAYVGTLGGDFFTLLASELSDLLFFKKLVTVGNEIGIDLRNTRLDHVDFEGVDIVGLEKMIAFLDADPIVREHPAMSQISPKLQAIRERKKAAIVAEREAEEAARIQKQEEELAAIEAARVAQKTRELEEAARELEAAQMQIETDLAEAERVRVAQQERLAAEQQQQLEAMERELEEERRLATEAAAAELDMIQQKLADELKDEVAKAEAEAERRLLEIQQEQAEAEAQLRLQAIEAEAAAAAHVEIAQAAQEEAVVAAVQENLMVEQEANAQALEETLNRQAVEQQAVVQEAEELKQEIVATASATMEKEKLVVEEKLTKQIESAESQMQELVELSTDAHSLESEQLDLEVEIHTDVLEEERSFVAGSMVEVAADSSYVVVEEVAPPRASKSSKVKTSRKMSADGSFVVNMRVPSDLTPGQFDEVSIFLSKEGAEVLRQYQRISYKIGSKGSLADVSFDEKKVLASAGAEFKRVREQYVQQRTEKIVARRQAIVARME